MSHLKLYVTAVWEIDVQNVKPGKLHHEPLVLSVDVPLHDHDVTRVGDIPVASSVSADVVDERWFENMDPNDPLKP